MLQYLSCIGYRLLGTTYYLLLLLFTILFSIIQIFLLLYEEKICWFQYKSCVFVT